MNGGIGFATVIRDDRGGFVAARALRIPGAWKPREAEAIETDSYALTNVCNGSPWRSLFDIIVIDCIELSKHMSPVLFCFAHRFAKNTAHARRSYLIVLCRRGVVCHSI